MVLVKFVYIYLESLNTLITCQMLRDSTKGALPLSDRYREAVTINFGVTGNANENVTSLLTVTLNISGAQIEQTYTPALFLQALSLFSGAVY